MFKRSIGLYLASAALALPLVDFGDYALMGRPMLLQAGPRGNSMRIRSKRGSVSADRRKAKKRRAILRARRLGQVARH